MAITTLTNVKTILNITVSDKDTWIDALIPQVESDYEGIRNRPFDVGTLVNIVTTAALAADEEMTITIGNWARIGSTARGADYTISLREDDTANIIARRIANQIEPSPYYNVKPLTNATSSSADVSFVEKFEKWTESRSILDMTVSTSTGYTATVNKLQTIYPDGAELTAAQMIQFNLSKPGGVKSESLGDYSVTYGDSVSGYPKSITGKIKRYVKTL